ncbi:hypothetical protein [Dyadobacter arcticus]|uniref:Preprotein translocase subunit SecE n=1 Tax=Dyadobacter arcticus TaxID=1078754 RepID=A0ABX0UKW5_9BACT|nr:hypothetical protein [Dyadobacter arcticus]NIJ53644.1 hypothetical protein [Dyadobacter arcticus]
MKVFPSKTSRKKLREPELSRLQTITRTIALILAFISVFVFFFKILFF